MVNVEEKVAQVKTVASRSIQKSPSKYLHGVNVKHSIESMPEASTLGEGIRITRKNDVIIGPTLIMYKCFIVDVTQIFS
jgi:hypothetical protein